MCLLLPSRAKIVLISLEAEESSPQGHNVVKFDANPQPRPSEAVDPSTSSTMSLSALPIDGICLILVYLDTSELTRLFCTFDRRMMKMLSFPGILSRLCLEPSSLLVSRAMVRYFVTHVRNVAHLSLIQAKWAPQSLSLLLTLNPISLDTDHNILHASSLRLLADLAEDPSNSELRSQASFLRSNGLPDFARLTTRLETLKFTTSEKHHQSSPLAVSLPSTLTSLKGNLGCDISTLPAGLRSLETTNASVSLKEVFSRLTQLEELSLTQPIEIIREPEIVFPSNFTRLNANYRGTKLVKIPNLPSTVTRIDMVSQSGAMCSTFPLGLRVLNLSDKSFPKDMASLSSLKLLEEVSINAPMTVSFEKEVGPNTDLFYLASLPSSVKSITIDCSKLECLSKACAITPRMIALISLIVHGVRLEEFLLFRKHAPHCLLYFETLSINGEMHSKRLYDYGYSPHPTALAPLSGLVCAFSVPNDALELTMRCDCLQGGETNSTFVRRAYNHHLSWLELTSMMDGENALHACSKIHSIEVEGVRLSPTGLTPPHALTHINLDKARAEVSIQYFPATLTRLTSKAIVRVFQHFPRTHWPMTNLKHLDTPKWTFDALTLGNLRDLEVFNAKIDNLADYNVIDLLTTAVGPKTRRNMRLSLSFYATGALVPDDDIHGLKSVDWSSIRGATTNFLKHALASPMPAVPSESGLSDNIGPLELMSAIKPDLIGRVVASLEHQLNIPDNAPICIPSSATHVNLDEMFKIRVFPNQGHDAVMSNGLRNQFVNPTLDSDSVLEADIPGLVFPRDELLVRLTLLNVKIEDRWMHQLPSSLRFLHLHHTDQSHMSMTECPPKLEVMILQAKSIRRFSFSALPTSLRKMALVTFIRDAQVSKDPGWTLPNLHTLILNQISAGLLTSLRLALLISPLKRFEVCTDRESLNPGFDELDIKCVSSIDLSDLLQDPCT